MLRIQSPRLQLPGSEHSPHTAVHLCPLSCYAVRLKAAKPETPNREFFPSHSPACLMPPRSGRASPLWKAIDGPPANGAQSILNFHALSEDTSEPPVNLHMCRVVAGEPSTLLCPSSLCECACECVCVCGKNMRWKSCMSYQLAVRRHCADICLAGERTLQPNSVSFSAAARISVWTADHSPCLPFAAFWRALVGSPRGGRELLALEGPRRMEPRMPNLQKPLPFAHEPRAVRFPDSRNRRDDIPTASVLRSYNAATFVIVWGAVRCIAASNSAFQEASALASSGAARPEDRSDCSFHGLRTLALSLLCSA